MRPRSSLREVAGLRSIPYLPRWIPVSTTSLYPCSDKDRSKNDHPERFKASQGSAAEGHNAVAAEGITAVLDFQKSFWSARTGEGSPQKETP